MNFWQKLKKPFTTLAPMEEVTDTVFRQIIVGVGRPDVFFTEFTNVEGLCSEGFKEVATRLKFTNIEKPIVAQIWGTNPENFAKTAEIIRNMGFDGIDINMGCPQKDVVKNGCCIGLVNNRNLAKEIVAATQEGAGKLPVSVKTRIGLNKIISEDWCGFLLEQKLDALTVHGRTAKEMSDVPAHWDEIAKVVKLRDRISPKTIIVGNGDVKNVQDSRFKVQEFGVDGVMIGRGVLENINCFNAQNAMLNVQEKIDLLKKHLGLWNKTWGETRNFAIMKKFFKIYIRDFDGAGELRIKLMRCKAADEVFSILDF